MSPTIGVVTALLFSLFSISRASFCGNSGVPYSFEVLHNGAPVLGCAQPTCLMSSDENKEDSQFLTDANGQADGFFRDGDRALKRFRHPSAPKLNANCSGQFNELSCPRKNQWVGGIEYIDHPRQPLILQCCTFDGLRFSQEVGTTTVGAGEAITGGEVIRNGRQISFDVIANVKKVGKQDGAAGIQYEVTVRRMNCLPDPPEAEVDFDGEVPTEVFKILSSAKGRDVSESSQSLKRETTPFNSKQGSSQSTGKAAGSEKSFGGEISSNPNEQRVAEPSSGGGFQQQQPAAGGPTQVQPSLPSSSHQQQQVPAQQQPAAFPSLAPSPIEQPVPSVAGFNNILSPVPVGQQQRNNPNAITGEGPLSVFQPQPLLLQQTEATTNLPPLPFSIMTFPTLPTFPPIPGFPTLPPPPAPGGVEQLGQQSPQPSLQLLQMQIPPLPPHQQPQFGGQPQQPFGTVSDPLTPQNTPPRSGIFPQLQNQYTGLMTPQDQQSGGQSVYMQMARQYQTANTRHSAPVTGPVYNNVPIMYPHIPPNRQPAAGTIMSQFKDSYYPIVHPTMGLIGYSNAPVHPITNQRMDGAVAGRRRRRK